MRKTTIAVLVTLFVMLSLSAFTYAQARGLKVDGSISVHGMAVDYIYPFVATTNGKIYDIAEDHIEFDMRDRLYYPEGPGLTAISMRNGDFYTYSINRVNGEAIAQVLKWHNLVTPTVIISLTGVLTNSHSTDFLDFSPVDGSLFLGFGDNAPFVEASPQHSEVLSLDSYRGKILRINPDTGQGYADNPFCNGDLDSMRCKVWAYGFRNPWSASFDNAGDLIVSDVGDHAWEEVNTHIRGGYFGWPCLEGESKSSFDVPECNGTIPKNPRSAEYAYMHDQYNGIMGAVKIDGKFIVGDFTGAIFDSDGQTLMRQDKTLVRLLQNGSSGIVAIYFDGTTRTSELVFLDYQFFYYIPSASK